MPGIDVLDPFMTVYREHPEYNPDDARQEAEDLATRQDLIQAVLEGREYPETLLDCLEEQGIGAVAWCDQVNANIEWVIDNGITFVSNDAGILVPK